MSENIEKVKQKTDEYTEIAKEKALEFSVEAKETFNELKEHYAGLSSSQAPHTLLVTCSDSRLSPQEFGMADSGELFIVRNAGNLIPAANAQSPSNEALTTVYSKFNESYSVSFPKIFQLPS